jgi:tetratricopeptide (TPR) repeat protein
MRTANSEREPVWSGAEVHLPRALTAGRLRMPQWVSGLALLTAVIVAAPETVSLVAASAQELPKVSVRTVRGPGSEKKPSAAPKSTAAPKPSAAARSRAQVAGTRTTYRRSARHRSTFASARHKPDVSPKIAAQPSAPAETAAAAEPRRLRRRHHSRRREDAPTQVASTDAIQGGAITLNSKAHRLQRQGHHDEAEPLLREALRKKPDYAYAQYNLGWSLVRQGKSKEAVLYLKRSSDAQPKRWEPLDKLAEAYEQMGQKQKAEETRQRVQELRGDRRHRSGRRREREKPAEEGAARTAKPVRSAVAPAAWQQSTDRREDAWFQEKREPLPAPVAVARD